MATLVMVVPNYLVSAPGPYYSPLQLAFVSAVCLGLYIAFLFIQTGWHRAYFLPIGDDDGASPEPPGLRVMLISSGLLPLALVSVVLLAKSLTPALEGAVAAVRAPVAVVGIVVAEIGRAHV